MKRPSSEKKVQACTDALKRALSSLAGRSYVRFLHDWERARRLADDDGDMPENLLAAAEALGVTSLVWGVEIALGDAYVAPLSALRALESDLDGLANAWFPLDSRTSLREALPAERRSATCSPRYRPAPGQHERAQTLLRAS
jgi:hypothetical protein